MALRMRLSDALLDYTLTTDPDPVRASGKDDPEPLRLMLKVQAKPGETAYLEKIEIRYKLGDGEHDLSHTSPDRVGQVVEKRTPTDLGMPWNTSRKSEDGYAVFTFAPDIDFDPCEFTADNTVTLALTGIAVNETVGSTDLLVTEWASRTDGGYQKVPLPAMEILKWPTAFTFQNFRPRDIVVKRGDTVTLSWEASVGPKYTLHWDDQHEAVSGRLSYPVDDVERTTAFMLMAEQSVGGGSAPLIHALTTAVTVTEPNLEVGNLQVNGIVRVQGEHQRLSGRYDDPRYFHAPTDGTLLGYVQGGSGGSAATLTVRVSRAGVNEYTMRFTSDNSNGSVIPIETPMSVPVPKDAQLRIVVAGDGRDTVELKWLPRGLGELREIPAP
jgi:hypothetical protein